MDPTTRVTIKIGGFVGWLIVAVEQIPRCHNPPVVIIHMVDVRETRTKLKHTLAERHVLYCTVP